MSGYVFNIADWRVELSFEKEDKRHGLHLLPSFAPFGISSSESPQFLQSVRVHESLCPVPKARRQHIRIFDTGNGDTVVDRLDNGGYQFVIRDIFCNDCAILITTADFSHCDIAINGDERMRRFGLNNAMMLAYSFAGAIHSTLIIHASVVRHKGHAYAFIAKSGTGKSTQTANWLRTIEGCDLMNDDSPIVRLIDGRPYVYGSPWSGKTPCYRKVKAPLGAITKIDRCPENSVEKISPLIAFATILPSCSTMKWDTFIYSKICDSVSQIISTTPAYILHCTASPVSAIVCHKAICRSGHEPLCSSHPSLPPIGEDRGMKRAIKRCLRLYPVPSTPQHPDAVNIPLSVLMPEIIRLIREGHTVTILLKGNSMRPFLCHNRDKGIFGKPEHIKVGDPVLALIDGHRYVMHRIIDISGDDVTLQGDGNMSTEHCKMADVKALAFAFVRKGRKKPDTIYGLKWRLYSFFWTRLTPFRHQLLMVHHMIFRSLKILDDHK